MTSDEIEETASYPLRWGLLSRRTSKHRQVGDLLRMTGVCLAEHLVGLTSVQPRSLHRYQEPTLNGP